MKISLATNELVSIQEASSLLNISIMTIYRWIKTKRLITLKLGAHQLIPISEIERLKKERKENKDPLPRN